MRDWLNEGVDPDDTNELTDDELFAEWAEREYWAACNNAWVNAGMKCQVCDTPLTLEQFADNHCPTCSLEVIPF